MEFKPIVTTFQFSF